MGSKLTFKVSWDNDPEKKSGFVVNQISCGDAEDIPVPVYMAILKALMKAANILNGETAPAVESTAPQPNVSDIEALEKMGEGIRQMGIDILNGDDSIEEEEEPVRVRGPVEPSALPPPPPPLRKQ